MLAVVIGLVLVLLVSIGIVLLVALPHLKSGSRILTPEGERTVKQAQEQAARTIHTFPGRRPGHVLGHVAQGRIRRPSRRRHLDGRPRVELGFRRGRSELCERIRHDSFAVDRCAEPLR